MNKDYEPGSENYNCRCVFVPVSDSEKEAYQKLMKENERIENRKRLIFLVFCALTLILFSYILFFTGVY